MHYRIFSILVTFVCLFGCALTTAAQDVNNTDETEKAGYTLFGNTQEV